MNEINAEIRNKLQASITVLEQIKYKNPTEKMINIAKQNLDEIIILLDGEGGKASI